MKALYYPNLLTYGMKKFINNNKTIIGLIGILALSLTMVGQQNKVFGMYEDQIEVCNNHKVCQVIDIDDYMTRDKADMMQYNFKHDLDTYNRDGETTQNKLDFHEDLLIQLDNECRDVYHSWCFGNQWDTLREVLTK